MRRGSVFVLLVVIAALLGSGFRSAPPAIGPGGKIGTMTLVRGVEHDADAELWGMYCDALLPRPGWYRRTCFVPRVRRLFIGYGEWGRTRKALDSVWRQLRWGLWLDGRRVDLARFGSSERWLHYFPAAGGKDVLLREWSVILVGVTEGTHVIRYRRTSRLLGTTDARWSFSVG